MTQSSEGLPGGGLTGPWDERYERMDRRVGAWVVAILALIGLWMLVSLIAPDITGHTALTGMLGGANRVNQFFLGFMFLYFAGVVKEKNALRDTVRGMVGLINKFLQQRNRNTVGEAVQILIKALDSKDSGTLQTVVRRLEQLTGQAFGEDRAAWEAWWADNRDTFQPVGGPEASGDAAPGD